MTEAKSTPGPWEACRWRVCHSVTGHVGVICDTAHNARTRTEENKANALLIAAAPDLLEACIAVLDYGNPGTPIRDSCAVRQKVATAIAKATGKDQTP